MMAAALIWCAPSLVHAEVYRWKDANGNVHFSDQPRPGAEQISIPPTSTINLPQPSAETQDQAPEEPQDDYIPYARLDISFPSPNSAFHSGNGTFTVTTDLEPPLRAIHELQLVLDGQVYARGQSGQFLLNNVDRGTHSLQLQVLQDGQVKQSSAVSEFTLHRPSLLNPNRPNSRP